VGNKSINIEINDCGGEGSDHRYHWTAKIDSRLIGESFAATEALSLAGCIKQLQKLKDEMEAVTSKQSEK